MVAWIKVLLAGVCPGPGSFDRIDGNRVGLVSGDNYSPLVEQMIIMQHTTVKFIPRPDLLSLDNTTA